VGRNPPNNAPPKKENNLAGRNQNEAKLKISQNARREPFHNTAELGEVDQPLFAIPIAYNGKTGPRSSGDRAAVS
jgi:hypothetical protein